MREQWQFRSEKIFFKLKSNFDLIRAIAAVEHVYRHTFNEEGDADIYFDLAEFPPARLPRGVCYPPTSTLEVLLTDGRAELKPFQRKALSPKKAYSGINYYLLGTASSDGDQIIPFFDDVVTVNKKFKVLSIFADSQDNEYSKYRQPGISLYALRGQRAVVSFSLLDLFEARTNDKNTEMKSVLNKTVAAYKTARAAVVEPKDYEEILKAMA